MKNNILGMKETVLTFVFIPSSIFNVNAGTLCPTDGDINELSRTLYSILIMVT